MSFFFFNDTATTEIYTLSLHDALPILRVVDSTIGHLVVAGDAVLHRMRVLDGIEMGGQGSSVVATSSVLIATTQPVLDGAGSTVALFHSTLLQLNPNADLVLSLGDIGETRGVACSVIS